MQDKLWYDHTKRHWYLKTDNQWHREHLVTVQTYLTQLGDQLPDTPYWARSKHRLSWFASQQPILSHIRHLCRQGRLSPPPVSDLA